jgi:hypothetical protein
LLRLIELVEMTSREDFLNAISLNSSIVNGARVVGPSVAGLPRVCSRWRSRAISTSLCVSLCRRVRDAIVLFNFKHSCYKRAQSNAPARHGRLVGRLRSDDSLGSPEADAVAHSISIKTI